MTRRMALTVLACVCIQAVHGASLSENLLIHASYGRAAWDNTDSGGYRVSFCSTNPASFMDAAQGTQINEVEALVSGKHRVFRSISRFDKDPQYQPPGTQGYRDIDYDQDGNLVVWRTFEVSSMRTATESERIAVKKCYRVSPSGKITVINDHYVVREHFKPDSGYNTAEIDHFLLGSGTGLFLHFGSEVRPKAGDTGGNGEFEIRGTFGKGVEGVWEVDLDAAQPGIVRRATFRQDDREVPLIVETTGTVTADNGFAVAQHGIIKHPGIFASGQSYNVQVEIHALRRAVDDPELRASVQARLDAEVPEGGEIADYRGDEPTVTIVRRK